jgi:hypothetical protein
MNSNLSAFFLRGMFAVFLLMLMKPEAGKAQGSVFQRVYGGYSYDFGNDLVQTPDGGYVLLATSASYSESADFFLMKITPTGSYEWHRVYGGSFSDQASRIIQLNNGGFLVAGHGSQNGNDGFDNILLRTDANGDLLWFNHYNRFFWDFTSDMKLSADGGILVCGQTYSDEDNEMNARVFKTDMDGNLLWQTQFGGSGIDSASQIIETANHIFVIGTSQSGPFGKRDIAIWKLDLDGTPLQTCYFGGAENDVGDCIIQTNDGNLVFAAHSNSYFTSSNSYNYAVNKIDENGVSVWPFIQYSNNTMDWFHKRLVELTNGEFALSGTLGNSNNPDLFLYKLNHQGYFINSASYGSYNPDYSGSFITTSDNGFALIGSTRNFSQGIDNIYFIKTDSSLYNNLNPQIQVNVEELTKEVSLNLQPTIFNTSAQLTVVVPHHASIRIYDISGRVCNSYFQLPSTETQPFMIQNINAPDGMYFLEITGPELSTRIRFVIQQ